MGIKIPILVIIAPRRVIPFLPLRIKRPDTAKIISPTAKASENHTHHFFWIVMQVIDSMKERSSFDSLDVTATGFDVDIGATTIEKNT